MGRWTTPAGPRTARLTQAFCIGLDSRGTLQIDDGLIVSAHAAVFLKDGHWWVRDLASGNLTLGTTPVQTARLPLQAMLAFGESIAAVRLEIEQPADAAPTIAPGPVSAAPGPLLAA